MVRFAADENLNNQILRGLRRRNPSLDVVRVQDAGLSGAEDREVLAWATREGRLLLTHDVSTIAVEVEKLIHSGTLPSGVLAIGRSVPVSLAIEDILLLAECSVEGGVGGADCLPATALSAQRLVRDLTTLPRSGYR